jgi:hypothetical protein
MRTRLFGLIVVVGSVAVAAGQSKLASTSIRSRSRGSRRRSATAWTPKANESGI